MIYSNKLTFQKQEEKLFCIQILPKRAICLAYFFKGPSTMHHVYYGASHTIVIQHIGFNDALVYPLPIIHPKPPSIFYLMPFPSLPSSSTSQMPSTTTNHRLPLCQAHLRPLLLVRSTPDSLVASMLDKAALSASSCVEKRRAEEGRWLVRRKERRPRRWKPLTTTKAAVMVATTSTSLSGSSASPSPTTSSR